MSAFVIVDPHSGSGQRDWHSLKPKLAQAYPSMAVAFPQRIGEVATLVSAALREGHSEIVAVGGTANEVLNGFFDAEGAISPEAVLAYVSIAGARDGLARLKPTPIRPIDVGRVQYLSREGIPLTRYFSSMASFGVSGLRAESKNLTLQALLDRLGFSPLFFRGRAVRLIIDHALDEIITIASVTIANGQVFGAPLLLTPDAKPDDGLFDVVITDYSPGKTAPVRRVQGTRIVAAPVEATRGRAVLVELDGGNIGRLPATFEILPRALNVRCSTLLEGP